MPRGKVKWYNESKGFGFIESENTGDIFVHRTGLHSSVYALDAGDMVEFETQPGAKGLSAVQVKKVR
jgi:CspA family cold shock protein